MEPSLNHLPACPVLLTSQPFPSHMIQPVDSSSGKFPTCRPKVLQAEFLVPAGSWLLLGLLALGSCYCFSTPDFCFQCLTASPDYCLHASVMNIPLCFNPDWLGITLCITLIERLPDLDANPYPML